MNKNSKKTPASKPKKKRTKTIWERRQSGARVELDLVDEENFCSLIVPVFKDRRLKTRLQERRRLLAAKSIKAKPEVDWFEVKKLFRPIGTWLSVATGFAGARATLPELVAAWKKSPHDTMLFIESCIAAAADPEARRILAVKQTIVENHDRAVAYSKKKKYKYRTKAVDEKAGGALANSYAMALAKNEIRSKTGKPIGAGTAQSIANRMGLQSGVRLDVHMKPKDIAETARLVAKALSESGR